MTDRQEKIIAQCKDRMVSEATKMLSNQTTLQAFNILSNKVEEYLIQNNIPLSLFVHHTRSIKF